MLFEEYYQEIIKMYDKLYYNYKGIAKKEYPKWAGWKIIDRYKKDGIPASEIDDKELDILVRNFYILQFFNKN